MPSVDVHQGKAREELANDGDRLVGNIFAMRASDKQCRPFEARLIGVFVREVAEVVERLG